MNVTQKSQWHQIDWKAVNAEVTNLRERIFVASEENDLRKVGNLQKLMMRSTANKLQAIRRVTQTNKGKNTPGTDGEIITTPEERWELLQWLSDYNIKDWTPPPTRRVEIPKKNGKMRPLGIPTIRDKIIQAMVKNALEPFWEARFEESSYGFRPGRSTHDAMGAIFIYAKGDVKRDWIVDADIKGAFDNIDHEFLMKTIGNFPGRELIRKWLEAGVMINFGFEPTPTGTPQGGIISPLLANIALHGMEEAFRAFRIPNSKTSQHFIRNKVVRYADDFVILTGTKEQAESELEVAELWLAERGLKLNTEKTAIRNIYDGFDFLGFNFQKVKNVRQANGISLYIRPPKEAIDKYKAKIRAEINTGRSPEQIIRKLNPFIRGWSLYYRGAISKAIYGKLDHFTWQRTYLYATKRHHNKGRQWIVRQYFDMSSTNKWRFFGKGNDDMIFLRRLNDTPTKRHIKVAGTNSPDNPTLHEYWEKRMTNADKYRSVKGALWRKQKGICVMCNDWLDNGEELDLHHVDRNRSNNTLGNLQLLHEGCHHKTHYQLETA